MSTISHPKYQFPIPTVSGIRYGSIESFPQSHSHDSRIQHFSELLFAHLRTLGITNIQHAVSKYNTGGHSDIDYYALIVINEEGGCECPFSRIGWTGEYEAMTPWVQLYGSWETHFESVSRFLRETFPS